MKTISWWDKFLVNKIGIIPNKDTVREYIKNEVNKEADYKCRALISKSVDESSEVQNRPVIIFGIKFG